MQRSVRPGSVWLQQWCDSIDVHGAVRSGLLLSCGLVEQHERDLRCWAVLCCRRGQLQSVSRGTVRQHDWPGELDVQWTVCGGSVRLGVGSDDRELQWAVCCRVCVQPWFDDSQSVELPGRHVLREWHGLCSMSGGHVRRVTWLEQRDVQWSV